MKPKLLLAIGALLVFAILVSGCTQQGQQNDTTGNTTVSNPPAQEPPAQEPEETPIAISLTTTPSTAIAGESLAIAWSIESPEKTINHTAVHYGPSSVSNPQVPADYPSASSFQCTQTPCSIPGSFSTSLSIPESGTYYYRAHAIVDGMHYWSSERTITVSAPAQAPAPEPEPEPSVQEFSILADDSGFYIDGSKVSSIQVSSGNSAKINFTVSTSNVYYGGLQIKGCGQDSGSISPGSSKTIEFSPSVACTLTSYWPLSGVVKARLQLELMQA